MLYFNRQLAITGNRRSCPPCPTAVNIHAGSRELAACGSAGSRARRTDFEQPTPTEKGIAQCPSTTSTSCSIMQDIDPSDPTVNIDFDTPQSAVGIWYTSFDLLTFVAYDSTNGLLASVVAPANTDGTTGSSDFVSLTVPNIASVNLTGSPGNFVFDDVSFSGTTSTAPEPDSMMFLLLGATLLMVVSKQPRLFRYREGSATNRN